MVYDEKKYFSLKKCTMRLSNTYFEASWTLQKSKNDVADLQKMHYFWRLQPCRIFKQCTTFGGFDMYWTTFLKRSSNIVYKCLLHYYKHVISLLVWSWLIFSQFMTLHFLGRPVFNRHPWPSLTFLLQKHWFYLAFYEQYFLNHIPMLRKLSKSVRGLPNKYTQYWISILVVMMLQGKLRTVNDPLELGEKN